MGSVTEGYEPSHRLSGSCTTSGPGAGNESTEGKAVSFVVGLIYYCLTSSDTDIPPPGLWTWAWRV